MRILIFILIIGFLLTGCNFTNNSNEGSDKPFILSTSYDSIEPEHEKLIDEWLSEIEVKNDSKVFNISLKDEGYEYIYAKGFNDAEVSFIYNERHSKGKLETVLKSGDIDDSLFIQVTYNNEI
ncbi:hypothetical protein LGQ02_11305 [Bacillus shivajii]|uniref:hypothetical protein n=1 Tax=Bacillus shivajii TaxID=1983719 RepID=UPI001CFB6B77|nr:hypothetical protein [Bacillus shivajii]UCZ51464.1 hypothetical protein LGQ02_11305 [Bacillus shivajii]